MGGRGMFLRVGLLVLVGIGAVIGVVLFLGGNNFSNGVELETYFRELVEGLDVGAPVNYLGVTLGRVTDIGLVTAEYGEGAPVDIRRATYRLVYVRFVINPRKIGRVLTPADVESAIAAGLRTRVASQGITGISYLSLDFLNPEQYPAVAVPWKPEYPYVPSVPSTFAQVQSAAERISSQLEQIDFKAIAEGLLGLTQTLQRELTSGEAHQTLTAATALLGALQTTLEKADTSRPHREPAQDQRRRREPRAECGAAGAAHERQPRRGGARGGRPRPAAADRSTLAHRRSRRRHDGRAPAAHDEHPRRSASDGRQSPRHDRRAAQLPRRRALRRAAAAGERRWAMRKMTRRASLLGLPLALAGCASALERPYVARQDWALSVPPPAEDAPARKGRKVLLVRSMLAGPALGDRGLLTLGPDGTMTTSFYERWAVPPAEGVGASLSQFLAQSGLFSAVLAPGSLADADLTLEPDLLALWAEPATGRAVASLSIVLLTAGSLNPRVLLQTTETATSPLPGQDSEAQVHAELAALAAVFRKIEDALAPFAA